MQVVFSIGILVLSICIYSLLGRAFCVKCRFCPTVPERLCIGFFLYFDPDKTKAACAWRCLDGGFGGGTCGCAGDYKKRQRADKGRNWRTDNV